MSDIERHPETREHAAATDAGGTLEPRNEPPFFDRTDWLGFGTATGIVFAVYLCTLAPDVTLEFSGILATGAYHAGVPHPPNPDKNGPAREPSST